MKSPISPRSLPFRTWIGDLGRPIPGTKFSPLPPCVPYDAPSEVPVPLRQTLRYAHDSGLTVDQLADVYELPREWITLFVGDLDAIAVYGVA